MLELAEEALDKIALAIEDVALALLLAALLSSIALQGLPMLAFIATAVAAVSSALIANRKIGGQTGDILGASQQVAECAVLLCLTL